MQNDSGINRISRITSLAVAISILVFIPIGYFITAYSYESRMLQDQADLSADAVSKLIYKFPDTWQFQLHRIEAILMNTSWHKEPVLYEIAVSNHQVLVSVGIFPDSPSHQAISDLSNGAKPVGYIVTKSSLRPMLVQNAVAFILAIVIATAAYFSLHTLPFAALRRLMDNLDSSKQQLAEEVVAKQKALDEYEHASKALRYQARHDMLTGLANRHFFQELITNSINDAKLNNTILAVLIIDLNRFKIINDTLGHEIGDKVLISVCSRISVVLSSNTIFARLGGDEFAVLIVDTSVDETIRQAQVISSALRSHIIINTYHLNVSASIGIAYYPSHGDSKEKLMSHADIAMYYAKQNAQEYYQYDGTSKADSPNILTLTADLRQAIDDDLLTLYYQPKISLVDDTVIGVEALTRWEHSHFGYISPEVFIPIAEQSGMINSLTDWLINKSLKQLSLWKPIFTNVNMAINISARNLQNQNLPDYIKSKLELYEIDPHMLTLEITESSIMLDQIKSKELIDTLSSWGIKIAIDDFGTGYSSLAYLKKLTINELKIDRSFVINMLQDQDDQVIVRSTIELAHNLNLRIVAEGVEDQATLNTLKEYGCDIAQGYYLCKPIPASAFVDWIQEYESKSSRIVNS